MFEVSGYFSIKFASLMYSKLRDGYLCLEVVSTNHHHRPVWTHPCLVVYYLRIHTQWLRMTRILNKQLIFISLLSLEIVRSCSVSSAHTLSYTSDHPLTSLTHVCTEAHITQELDHSTANGTVALNNLLPSCSYVFRVTYEDGETVSCDYTTPFDIGEIM